MAKPKLKPTAPPIIDIELPGKSAPSGNSKSVIIPNRPIMSDPMMVAGGESPVQEISETETKPIAAPSAKKPKFEPVLDEPKVEEPKPEAPAKEEASPEATDSSDTADPTDPINEQLARQAEHDANIQKIVDAKTYYLPINSIEKRRTKRFIILGIVLSVVLVIAWADIALDAGLIHVGGAKSVTHFFSN